MDSERQTIYTYRFYLLGLGISRMWEKTMAIQDYAESKQQGVKTEILEAQKGVVVSLSY